MAISKVIVNNVTKMDVTDKTVDTTNLLSGYTATKNDGTQITGQASQSALSMDTITTTTSSTTLLFSGITYTSVPSFLIVMLMSTGNSGTCFYYYSVLNTSPSPSGCWEAYTTNRGPTVNTSATVPTIDSWSNKLIINTASTFPVGTYIMYYIM